MIATIITKDDIIKSFQDQLDNYRCCGNCKYIHICIFDDMSKHPFILCKDWEYDGLTYEQRMK